MKKFLGFTLGMLAAAAVVTIAPATVKAAELPCTQATIQQFQNNLAVAQAELAQVEAVKAQADANVAALKAQGVTGLQMLQATDAATNAANMVAAYKGKVANCQASLANIIGRGQVEDYYLGMEAKWKNRAQLDALKLQLDGANQITSAALTQLNNLKSLYACAVVDSANSPALAGNVASLQGQVAAAEANYASKKAASDALAAQYATMLNTLNFATDADNAAYKQFVTAYGTNMAQEYKLLDADGKEYTVFTYYNNNPYVLQKPNEWSIRWFE